LFFNQSEAVGYFLLIFPEAVIKNFLKVYVSMQT